MAPQLRTAPPPAESEITAAGDALPEVQSFLQEHRSATVVLQFEDDGTRTTVVVPRAVVVSLADVLLNMAQGRAVSIIPAHAILTTQQAADMLNVSRPFLIGLLNAGEIPHRMVGSHRRVLAEDVLAYRRADDERRLGAADALTALTEEMGLY